MILFEYFKKRREERRIKREAIKNIILTLKQIPMNNLKDKATNVAGFVLFICGTIISVATAGVALPAVVVTGAIIGATVSGSVVSYFTGKDPNGSKKTDEQIQAALKPNDK